MLDRSTRADRARERKRRFQQRRRDGKFVAPIEITPQILDCLTELHWPREIDAANPRKVAAAIAAMLADVGRK